MVKMTESQLSKVTGKKINEIKGWVFEDINQLDKPLAKLSRKKRKD